MNPTYTLFPVFAFCSFFLVLIPLRWHVQAWNVGTCAYIIWASVACLLEFINSVVWNNNTSNSAPVWCDISSKILLGAGVGIPAAGLCISRRLYTISAIKSTVVTSSDKRRAVIIDSSIAFGIPLMVMALREFFRPFEDYVVQTNRFNILEDVGCWPAIFNTPLAYFLVFLWPVLLGCVSFVFSALTLRAFYKRRLEFTQFLSAHSSFSMNRYIRLMLLAICEMLSTIPMGIYSAYIANKDVPIQPWISWDDTHYDFSYVGQVTAAEWTGDPNFRISVELTRWLFPASALLFFMLFGFGTEARKHYHAAFLRVAKVLGYKSALDTPVHTERKFHIKKTISIGSLPIYVPNPAKVKQKHTKPLVSSAPKCSDIDVEKLASCSSPSVASFSPDYQQPFTRTSGDVTETQQAMTNVLRTDPATIPAYHLPFMPPSIYRTPRQSSRSVCITVHTQSSVSYSH